MGLLDLDWLPERPSFAADLRSLPDQPPTASAWLLRSLATSRLDLPQVLKLDRALSRSLAAQGGALPGLEPVRLAVLGSATTSHLPPAIRVAGLRRGLAIEIYEGPYGTYWQELMDPGSGLHRFQPEVLLLALDARHLAGAEGATVPGTLDLLRSCWRHARASFHCQVLQQTLMPVLPDLLGHNEHRLPSSPAALVAAINQALPPAADEEGIDLLALHQLVAGEGLAAWHDPALWHRSKHEVHLRATSLYGDHVARLVAAARGRSAKCLVLDLDNTLWGGVIGDDGLEGIVLGQGSPAGEAHAELQRYARGLGQRGVVLAVCSKNDAKNAVEPFEKHPEMLLKRSEIACFVANWTDKASNLRTIASTLSLGLDSLVFVDDNPAERALIRRELPEVAVPELPEDPAGYVPTLVAAGYFEGLRLTAEDQQRSAQYQANAERERLREGVTDVRSYLESLRMVMTVGPFDSLNLARVTQLINKTNQFNLMTERLTESEVAARMRDPQVVTLQARLADRFGDNGIIAILMARVHGSDAIIETWLMSCRVLGRTVEAACLNVLVYRVGELGATRLIGQYRPTEKNGMVRDLYPNLGFEPLHAPADPTSSVSRWVLDLANFQPRSVTISLENLSGVAVL